MKRNFYFIFKMVKKTNENFLMFREKLNEWCLNLNAYGLPKVFKAQSLFFKLFWLISFTVSLGYCIYAITMLVNMFLHYPSYSNTKIIEELPALFPMVSFCNMKTINKTAASDYLNLNGLILNKSISEYASPYDWIINQRYMVRNFISNDNLTEEIRKSYGFRIEEMLISCYFRNKACSKEDFKYFYHPFYGNCYSFNTGQYNNGTKYEIKDVVISGNRYGLILELLLGDPSADSINEFHDGVIISIDNQSFIPFINDDVIKASAGAETDLIISREFITKLPKPYGDCLEDTSQNSSFNLKYFKYITQTLKINYSEKFCYSLCIQQTIFDTCGCTNINLPVLKHDFRHHCITSTEIKCFEDIIFQFTDTLKAAECRKSCPFECFSINYDVASYSALYPTKAYQDVLFNFSTSKGIMLNYNTARYAFAKVNIFYHNMQYKVTIESPTIDPLSLFSSLFGTLNFYTGMNVFTLIEVIELLIALLLMAKVALLQKQAKVEPLNN